MGAGARGVGADSWEVGPGVGGGVVEGEVAWVVLGYDSDEGGVMGWTLAGRQTGGGKDVGGVEADYSSSIDISKGLVEVETGGVEKVYEPDDDDLRAHSFFFEMRELDKVSINWLFSKANI